MILTLLSLFFSCFLAATVLPFSSEIIFGFYLKNSGIDVSTLILTAALGNTFGGLSGYWLGRLGKLEWLSKYFRIKPDKLHNFEYKAQRYGLILALFSWLPFVGDFFCVALGFFRARFWPCAILMFIGKLLRYVVVAWLVIS